MFSIRPPLGHDQLNIFNQMCEAISRKNYILLSNLIKNFPEALQEKDSLGFTVLHYAVMNGTLTSIKMIVNQLILDNAFVKVIHVENLTDDTILHLAAQFNNLKVLKYLVRILNNYAAIFCQRTNHQGKTPLLLVVDNPFKLEHVGMRDVLLAESLKFNCPDLAEAIDEKAVLDQFQDAKYDQQWQRIVSACTKAINKARREVKFSFTHPQTNRLDAKEKYQANAEIISLRKEIKGQGIQFNTDAKSNLDNLPRHTTVIRKRKSANCGELATDTAGYLIEDPNCVGVQIETAYIQANAGATGDHAFVVAARNLYPKRFILADAYSGTIVVVNQSFYDRRMTYYNFEGQTNLIAFPNRKFAGHQIKYETSFMVDPSPRFALQITTPANDEKHAAAFTPVSPPPLLQKLFAVAEGKETPNDSKAVDNVMNIPSPIDSPILVYCETPSADSSRLTPDVVYIHEAPRAAPAVAAQAQQTPVAAAAATQGQQLPAPKARSINMGTFFNKSFLVAEMESDDPDRIVTALLRCL